jgi:hypothetical protein
MRLPDKFPVHWIGTEQDCEKLLMLLEEPYIGVDAEWRPNVFKFHVTKPSLFQLSGLKNAFLVDLFSLANNPVLDEALTKVFSNKNSVIVGFSFDSDMS